MDVTVLTLILVFAVFKNKTQNALFRFMKSNHCGSMWQFFLEKNLSARITLQPSGQWIRDNELFPVRSIVSESPGPLPQSANMAGADSSSRTPMPA